MSLTDQIDAQFMRFERTTIAPEEFEEHKRLAASDPAAFYAKLGEELLVWNKPFMVAAPDEMKPFYRFFDGGTLSPLENILTKHLSTQRKNKAAVIWKSADRDEVVMTYQSLYSDVVKCASAFRKLGLKRGMRVLLHLPNVPELIVAMLACTKLGATHVVYHHSYSAESLAERIDDCTPQIVVCSDASQTGSEQRVKQKVDDAIAMCRHQPAFVVVVERMGRKVHMKPLRDIWYHDLISDERHTEASRAPDEELDAEDTLFMLYTSTNLAEPKALSFPVAGYLLWAYYSYLLLFDCKDTDTYWCTADISWITGHTYIVYGPLMAGQTILLFEDTIDYDNAERFYDICEKFHVNKLYMTPSILRSLMNAAQKKKNYRRLSGIEILATGGEKMPDDVFQWSFKSLGNGKALLYDIYSLTETGGAVASAIPGLVPMRLGTVSHPLPGAPVSLVETESGAAIDHAGTQGALVLDRPFPPLCRTMFGFDETFRSIYWKQGRSGAYFKTGDGAEYDEDGALMLRGRLDEVLHMGGKRISLVEIEEVVRKHEMIKDCAVVSISDEKRGDRLIAFCILDKPIDESYIDHTVQEIREIIIGEFGEAAVPHEFRFTRTLPKSPEGVILRDLLKDIALQM